MGKCGRVTHREILIDVLAGAEEQEKEKKVKKSYLTDGRTDKPTDRSTDIVTYTIESCSTQQKTYNGSTRVQIYRNVIW